MRKLFTHVLAAVALVTTLLAPAYAQTTRTWTGAAGNGNWADAANWSPAGSPVTGDSLVIMTAGSAPTANNLVGVSLQAVTFSLPGYTLGGNPIGLQSGGTITVGGSGTMDIAQGLVLSGPATIAKSANVILGPVNVTGSVTGIGSLTFEGSGTATLTGLSLYSGATTVNGGVLHVSGQVSTTMTVNSGAQLTVTGEITGNGITVASGGTLRAQWAFSARVNDLTLASGSTFLVDVGPNVGRLRVGALNITGATLAANDLGGYVHSSGNSFPILIQPQGPVVGTFNGAPHGSTVTLAGHPFRIAYQGTFSGGVELLALNGPELLATPDQFSGTFTISDPVGGGATTRNIIMENTGNADLTVTPSGLSGVLSISPPGTTTIAPGFSNRQIYTVSCAATTATTTTQSLTMTTNDADEGTIPYTVECTGTPTAPEVAPAPAAGATVTINDPVGGGATTQTITMSNTGTGDLTVTPSGLSGVLSISPPGLMTISAGATQVYTIGCDATATTTTAQSLTMTTNDSDEGTIPYTVQCIGIPAGSPGASFTGTSGTGSGTIVASFTGGGAGCAFATAQFIPASGHAASPPAGSAPAGVAFPHGLFDFTTSGCSGTLNFTIAYPTTLDPATQYWKYGPTATSPTPHWYVLPATIAGNAIMFSIADGGLGDDDLAVNGTIVDQGGPGVPGTNNTAMWWNPAESGWGVNFAQLGDTLFATLFTYDAARRPLWLSMSNGQRQSGESFSGALYRTVGSPFNANPVVPMVPADITQVGAMTVTFSGDTATVSYTVEGVAVTKTVQKYVFGSRAATCFTSSADRTGLTNYQDLWWNPAESGWGVNLTHQDNTIFATLFSYGADSRGVWWVMSGGTRQPDGSFQGTLYQTTGPPFNAVPFAPIGTADMTAVGTMRLQFTNGTSGTITFSVNGVTVSKAIVRYVVSSSAPSCN